MSTAITKLTAATTAVTVQTIMDLDAMLAPLEKPAMWDFWAAAQGGGGVGYRPEEWRTPDDQVTMKPFEECLAPVDQYIAEFYPQAMAIITLVQEPPITKFIIMQVRALMVSKPSSGAAAEGYMEVTVNQIETTVPKFLTAAIIAGFRKLIRSPREFLLPTGAVIEALEEAEAEFRKQVSALTEFKSRRDRAVAIQEDRKRRQAEYLKKHGPPPSPKIWYPPGHVIDPLQSVVNNGPH